MADSQDKEITIEYDPPIVREMLKYGHWLWLVGLVSALIALDSFLYTDQCDINADNAVELVGLSGHYQL